MTIARRAALIPLPIVAAAGAVAVTLLGDQMLYTVMPASPQRWTLSIAAVGVLLSANRFIRLLSNPLAAVLFHRYGVHAPFAVAMAATVVITAAYGWLTSFWLLLAARCAWGVCWSVLRLGGQWTVLDEATDADRGRLMGWYTAVTRSGAVGGALLGGLLAEAIGHRLTLTAFAVVTALVGLAWHFATRQHPGARPPTSARSSLAEFIEVARVLRDRALLLVSVSGLVVGMVSAGLLGAALGFYFRAMYGDQIALGPLTIGAAAFTGVMLGLRSLSDVTTGPIAGAISDRVGRVTGTIVAILISAVSVAVLALATTLWLALIAILVAFVSAAAALVQLQTAAGDLAPPSMRAAVLSAYATFQDLGAALGPLLGLAWESLDALRILFFSSACILTLVAITYSRFVVLTPHPLHRTETHR